VDSESHIVNLEGMMEKASSGDLQAAYAFYETLINESVIVPERHQNVALSHNPEYPNEILNILGIKNNDRIIVPVFLSPEYIETWCGQKLLFRKMFFSALIDVLPPKWWICLNPGQEITKEFSPWELERLKSGTHEIPEILAELFGDLLPSATLSFEPQGPEYDNLKELLSDAGKEFPEVREIRLIAQMNEAVTETQKTMLLLGVLVDPGSKERRTLIRDYLINTAHLALIGLEEFRVFLGSSIEDDISLSLFAKIKPFYTR